MSVVKAAHDWVTNADLVYDAWRLGYVKGEVYDVTPGERGLWWNWYRYLEHEDITIRLNDQRHDFTNLPIEDESFDTVAFDPPYKLNGNPQGMPELSRRYGVEITTRWQDRHALMVAGLRECARIVRPKGYVLVKCQDQVCSGKMRWQTDLMTECGTDLGLDKVDEFLMLGHHIPQPMEGRKQKHAHARPSSLLIFQKR